MTVVQILTLIGFLVAIAPGIYAIWNSRRKTEAEAADIIQNAAEKMVRYADQRLDRMREDLDRFEAERATDRAALVTMTAELALTREQLRETNTLLLTTQEELRLTREALDRSEMRLEEAQDKLDRQDNTGVE